MTVLHIFVMSQTRCPEDVQHALPILASLCEPSQKSAFPYENQALTPDFRCRDGRSRCLPEGPLPRR